MAINRATKVAFFDTDVLLYLLSPSARKAGIAEHLVSLAGTSSVAMMCESHG